MVSLNWNEAHLVKGIALDYPGVKLLNSLSSLQSSWNIVLVGDVVCTLKVLDNAQKDISSLYLHFQCGSELLKIGLDSLGFLWLHPILSDVPYGIQIPDTFIMPILKELCLVFEKKLQSILHTPVQFLGHFYELDETNTTAIHFALYNQQLAIHRKNVGLDSEYIQVTVYVPLGVSMLALLEYLSTFPKQKNIPVDRVAIDVWVRAGYCFLTLKQLENIRVGDVLITRDFPFAHQKATLVFLDQELPCVVENGLVKISNFQGIGIVPRKHIESWESENTQGLPIAQIKSSLFVSVSFDIVQETVTLQTLSQIKPGYTLKIDVTNQLIIRVHERVIAIGEPTEFQGTMGVKIIKLL